VISGAPITVSDINGIWTVVDTVGATNFEATQPGIGEISGDTGGIVSVYKTVTIDAQLSVRNIIQAILFQ
jgi:hypothetical protein